MKISSVSKKVLASALSAAMVVAFAPTVAFGGTTVVAKNSYVSAANGQTVEVEYYDAALAFAKAGAPESILDSNKNPLYSAKKATVALADDVTVTDVIKDDAGTATTLTVDLGGKKLTSKAATGALSHTWAFTTVGDGTIAATGSNASTFAGVTVGTEDTASNVTFDGGTYTSLEVVNGTITIEGGTFTASATNLLVLKDALTAAEAAGATIALPVGVASISALNAGDTVTVTKTVATEVTTAGTVVPYSDLATAISSASAGSTVTLAKDVDFAGKAATSTSKFNLDLAGHSIDRGTITAGNGFDITIQGEGKLTGVTTAGDITIDAGANVTVDDSAVRKDDGTKNPTLSVFSGNITVNGALTVANDATTSAAVVTVENGGTLTASKGKLGNVTVNAGGNASFAAGTYGTLTVKQNATAKVEGGNFAAIAPENKDGVNLVVSAARYGGTELNKKYVAAGSVYNEYAVGANEIGAPVATATKVDLATDNKTEYKSEIKCASLQGAVYNAAAKTTVVLAADVDENVTAAKELTIDLGGHTVKGAKTGAAATITSNAGGKVTIKNGSVIGNGYEAVKVAGGGQAFIESGTYTAEVRTESTGAKTRPAKLVDVTGISGGTFKDATFGVTVAAKGISGGTFDKQPVAANLATKCSATKNADGTYTVALGDTAKSNFVAVNGVATAVGTTKVTVADQDKALEKAVDAAYSKVLTAAWSMDKKGTALDGFKFAEKDTVTHETYAIGDLTGIPTANLQFVLEGGDFIAEKDRTIKADKDYGFDWVTAVNVAVVDNTKAAGLQTIGYLTGIDVDVTWEYAQTDIANWTYGFVGADAKYDVAKKTWSFSTKTGEQFGVESISNSILELQEQVKQMEIAAQDKAAANTIKGTAKTIKTKKGVTAKKYTVKVKAVTSESGAVATFKKANTAGKSKITVAKSGTITIKKGLKKGTYKVKVKGTVGASSKTVTAKIVIK